MNPRENPDAQFIRSMFDNLAVRYDIFNHLTSMGFAGGWRKRALVSIKEGMRVLDLGCGTGDLALSAMTRVGAEGEVVGLDFSEKMLAIAGERAKKITANGHGKLRWVFKKAEELPIDGQPFDIVVSGFVLRNLYENIDAILKGVYRSLKIGGQISFLDITDPENKYARFTWRLYMNTVTALYGRILFGKSYPAFYLTDSAKRFLRARDFAKKLECFGFTHIQMTSFMCGTVTLYEAKKA